MSGLSLERVEGTAALERFVRLPERLMAGDPNWVPPLRLERRRALQARHNPLFRHAAAARWIARRDGRDVGRISAQDDELAPPGPDGDRPGHWGWLAAAPDDAEALWALLGAAGDWLRGRGRRRMLGPFSSSINEEAGLLVRGFDSPPMLMMPHDPPGLGDAVEALGHRPAMDLHAFLFDPRRPLPRGPRGLVARGLPAGVRLRRLRMGDYRAEVGRLVAIFNDAWAGNWGFAPMTPAELEHMAAQMRPLVREELVWFAEVEGEAAAFILCLPDLNALIRDLGGRLLPTGWARLLWRLRRARPATGRVPLMGVRRAHAAGVLGALLPFQLIEAVRQEAVRLGMTAVELSWVLDNNAPMLRIAEALGAERRKTYRLYETDLLP